MVSNTNSQTKIITILLIICSIITIISNLIWNIYQQAKFKELDDGLRQNYKTIKNQIGYIDKKDKAFNTLGEGEVTVNSADFKLCGIDGENFSSRSLAFVNA